MSIRITLLWLGLILTPLFTIAQSDMLAMNEARLSLNEVSVSSAPSGIQGERVVTIDVKLYVESDVMVEIRDALGKKLFASEATYPEGDRKIKVGVGDMIQGLYFVKVITDLDEIQEIVIVEQR